jgi:hypothetical protein
MEMEAFDYLLPLMGAHTELLLTEKLKIPESWAGKVFFRKVRWVNGMMGMSFLVLFVFFSFAHSWSYVCVQRCTVI